jgi:hypothetical protein
LLKRLSLPGNRLIILKTIINESKLRLNIETGLGELIDEASIVVSNVYLMTEDQLLQESTIEEVMALSLQFVLDQHYSFDTLVPRSISVLPIASGCQARCEFCFSKASVSIEQRKSSLDKHALTMSFSKAKERGAARAVITGGGEPTLYPRDDLLEIIRLAADYFPNKVVLITNGYVLSQLPGQECSDFLLEMQAHGLTNIAFSHHHWKPVVNEKIMNLSIDIASVLNQLELNPAFISLSPRLICVLQKNGIATIDDISNYLRWAATLGVEEVCFKELYVSTSVESVYYTKVSNEWSLDNQIPLSILLNYFKQNNWIKIGMLPWGAPIYEGNIGMHKMRVAAYTEPSIYWEISHGICRSWNVMADGKCFASLEDKRSEVSIS